MFKTEWQRKLAEEFKKNPAFEMAIYSSTWAKRMWNFKNEIIGAIIKRGDKEKYDDVIFDYPTGWGYDTMKILRICKPELFDEIKNGVSAREATEWIEEVLQKS